MEWRRFVTYLWNDPRIISYTSTRPIYIAQGCVRGQHGRGQGQGQGQGSSRPRPMPKVFEAKAKAKAWCLRGQGQGHKILSSRSRPVLEDPHPWAFYRTTLRREQLCQVVCLSITLKFNALLPPLVLVYEVLYLWH